MKILVTGATGFMGQHLVRELLRRQYKVRVVTRNRGRAAAISSWQGKPELVEADITQRKTLVGIARGVTVVYHLAGMLGQQGAAASLYWRLHYTGTRNILEEACREKVVQFIHCSSAGVLGPVASPPADESFPYTPSNTYERTKAAAEKLVLGYYQRHKLPLVIIRPEFVYGPGDLHVLGLFRAIQKGFFVILGSGNSLLHPTYIDDAIQGLLLCLHRKDCTGEIFLIAGEKAVPVSELSSTIASELGVRPPFRMPLWLAKFIAMITDKLHLPCPLNQARLAFFTQNRSFDIGKAMTKLGYQPQFSLKEGVKKTIEWYRQEGYL